MGASRSFVHFPHPRRSTLDAIARNMPPPRLATAFLGNTAQAQATLRRLHDLHRRNPEARLTPYHCPIRAAEAAEGNDV